MIDKSKITRGKQAVPLKVLLLGSEGVGKTTFAAGAPKPFIIDLDRGSYEQDVARVEADTFDDVLEWCEHARTDASVETLVIDSLSRLEALVSVKVCGPNDYGGLAAFGGGYGKGDDAALQHWRHFLAVMDRVSVKKNVLLIGHTTIKSYNDPIGLAFDRHSLGLREKAAGPIKQWVNYTLYARTEVSTRVHDKTKKSLGVTTGARYIYTDNNPAYDAKHRGNLPAQLPLSWQAFADAIAADRTSCAEKLALIAALLGRVDAPTAAKVRAAAKANETNSVQLAAIIGRLQTIIDTNETSNETNDTNEKKDEKKS
jgi:hypothetical protein